MSGYPILYVEDDENDAFFMRAAWTKAVSRNSLHIVTDGEKALEYLSGQVAYGNRDEHPMPGLVLLDLKLPRLNGLDVLSWIRGQPSIHTLPVIMFSSSNNPQDVYDAYRLHANAYLVKPSHPQDLAELVASLKEFWLGRVEFSSVCVDL